MDYYNFSYEKLKLNSGDEFIEYIITSLGGNVFRMELLDGDIHYVMNKAVGYCLYNDSGVIFQNKYITLPLNKGQHDYYLNDENVIDVISCKPPTTNSAMMTNGVINNIGMSNPNMLSIGMGYGRGGGYGGFGGGSTGSLSGIGGRGTYNGAFHTDGVQGMLDAAMGYGSVKDLRHFYQTRINYNYNKENNILTIHNTLYIPVILLECKYRKPFVDLYNNEYFRRYFSALLKLKWVTNVTGKTNVELPMGTLNLEIAKSDAEAEIEAMETMIKNVNMYGEVVIY